ncbi:uncharacterized protein N7477_005760 [Penicillium maclennaniae]|uniref:uncharacterized protein n=1 Tax=Penicillium maclennaniae TaxID=1343394 RepID=UPI0025422BC5|nr:uncharacterized protein N7477_005760 [Penicillium maclennaniae]KAJ5670397.1 hypothetical protein N7477_005760 [Penicillium maclennaniae]
MVSATEHSQDYPVTIEARDDEPLLGHPGDILHKPDDGIYRHLFAALVWNGFLSQPLSWFTPHPLLSVSALLLQVQATLIVQPVNTPQQKLKGARVHYSIQLLSIVLFILAFINIEVNKGSYPHFVSLHGILGLTTYITIALQAVVGVIQYFLPTVLLGSVDAGKRIYKYHRWSGHFLLLLEMATVLAAVQSTNNMMGLQINFLGVLVAVALILVGVGAGIQKRKLGL